jgi:hypothetical protein
MLTSCNMMKKTYPTDGDQQNDTTIQTDSLRVRLELTTTMHAIIYEMNTHLEYCSDSCLSLCNSIKIRYVSMFILSTLFHNMFQPNWPSSGVQGMFKESSLLSFGCIRCF